MAALSPTWATAPPGGRRRLQKRLYRYDYAPRAPVPPWAFCRALQMADKRLGAVQGLRGAPPARRARSSAGCC